jgi:hypothetical protein
MTGRGDYARVRNDPLDITESAIAMRQRGTGCRSRSTGAHDDILTGMQRMRARKRGLHIKSAILWMLFAGGMVGILFLSLHVGICSGEDPHSRFFPEPFRVPIVIETVAAQTLSKFLGLFGASFLLGGVSTEPGSQATLGYASVVLEYLAKHTDVYMVSTTDSTVHVTDSCNVTITVTNGADLSATDAAWFRPVKSTCKNVLSASPLTVQLAPEEGVILASFTGVDVVLLFQDMPFVPLVGNAHEPREGQPLFVQLDRALWGLLANASLLVTATAHISQRTVTTYVITPITGAENPLMYVAANLDGDYTSSDNWGSLALLLQLMDTLRYHPVERERTAFVLGNANSAAQLVSTGLLRNVLDLVLLSHCGLINGRDALYSSKSSLVTEPMLRTISTSLVLGQPAYLSGRAIVSPLVAVWDITSFSSAPKTIPEATVAGGTAGVPVAPRSPPVDVSHTAISVLTLIAQLQSLQWMLEAGAISGSGISALFAQ